MHLGIELNLKIIRLPYHTSKLTDELDLKGRETLESKPCDFLEQIRNLVPVSKATIPSLPALVLAHAYTFINFGAPACHDGMSA